MFDKCVVVLVVVSVMRHHMQSVGVESFDRWQFVRWVGDDRCSILLLFGLGFNLSGKKCVSGWEIFVDGGLRDLFG